MGSLRQLLTTLGPKRAALMGAVALVILGLTASLAFRSGGGGPQAYLFTDLDPAGARTVTERLTQLNVEWSLSPDGSAVMVPSSQVSTLRMALAGEQIAGKVGYEVLDAENPFGVSDSRAKINHTRAIEGELARSIETLDRVERARVHIVMPDRPLFVAESRPASAAVTLRTTGRLPQSAVDAIRSLVAAAVPELSPDRISVVDQRGTLLARGGEGAGGAASLDERQVALEARLRAQVEALIERAVGPGRARVEVAAELARVARRDETDRFDPDGQVVARQTTVENQGDDSQGEASAPVTVANQLAERNQPGANMVSRPGDMRRSTNREVSEETAFNSSRTRSTVVEEAGRLSRLTISVLVDPKTATGRTLSRGEVDRLTRLVETAVGFDARRGDRVVVEALPMVTPEAAEAAAAGEPLLTVGQWITIGIGALLAAAIVAAALIARGARRKRGEAGSEPAVNDNLVLQPGPGAADPTPQLAAAGQLAQAALPQPSSDDSVTMNNVKGAVRSSVVRKAGEAIMANPAEATALVRQMMTA